jgi:hypothetical protein
MRAWFFFWFLWISYGHLNVSQTSDNPIDCLKTPAKPHMVSPNPNVSLDHTLDPIMTVGSSLLEDLSREGLPWSVRGWFYDMIGWTIGRSAKSRVLRPDWLELFSESCRWIGTLVGLVKGHRCRLEGGE